ncbi:hypothetical protein U0070_000378, partial [Myodes glareolus]
VQILSLIVYFINILTLLVPVLIAIAFLTLVERKILGYIQLRKGPNISGPKSMNSTPHTTPPSKPKPRSPIYPSHIKPISVLNPVVRMSIQLQILHIRSPTSSSTNNFIRKTNRAPFDLTEGESELVSGFNVEYAAGPFALFFIAEYINIILINALSTIVFLGPFHDPYDPELYTTNFILKTLLLTTLPSLLPTIPIRPTNTPPMKKFPSSNISLLHMTHLNPNLHSKYSTLHLEICLKKETHNYYIWLQPIHYVNRPRNKSISPDSTNNKQLKPSIHRGSHKIFPNPSNRLHNPPHIYHHKLQTTRTMNISTRNQLQNTNLISHCLSPNWSLKWTEPNTSTKNYSLFIYRPHRLNNLYFTIQSLPHNTQPPNLHYHNNPHILSLPCTLVYIYYLHITYMKQNTYSNPHNLINSTINRRSSTTYRIPTKMSYHHRTTKKQQPNPSHTNSNNRPNQPFLLYPTNLLYIPNHIPNKQQL